LDNLPSKSLAWCRTPETKHNYNHEQHKNLNNHARELPIYVQTKPNETGLAAAFMLSIQEMIGPILQLPEPAWGHISWNLYFS